MGLDKWRGGQKDEWNRRKMNTHTAIFEGGAIAISKRRIYKT